MTRKFESIHIIIMVGFLLILSFPINFILLPTIAIYKSKNINNVQTACMKFRFKKKTKYFREAYHIKIKNKNYEDIELSFILINNPNKHIDFVKKIEESRFSNKKCLEIEYIEVFDIHNPFKKRIFLISF